MNVCEYDCTSDSYQGNNLELMQYCLTSNYPSRISNLEGSMLKIEKRRLADRYRNSKVIKCSKGTPHLWKMRVQNFQSAKR